MQFPETIGENQKVIYIHIPKTAGTSIRSYFSNIVGKDRVGWLGVDFNYGDLNASYDFSKYRIIGGHFTSKDVRALNLDAVYFSTIREPVARALSYYRYILAQDRHPMKDKLQGDLRADLEGIMGRHLRNQQCGFLGARATFEVARKTISGPDLGVGLVEDVGIMLAHIAQCMGCEPIDVPVTNRAAGKKPQVDDDILDLLREIMPEDLKLYNWMCDARRREAAVFASASA